jgi:hypothetical protein
LQPIQEAESDTDIPIAELRRILMRATRNHVYDVERDDHVLVVAVWGAVKHGGPDLTDVRR